jgi:hypothetical protein
MNIRRSDSSNLVQAGKYSLESQRGLTPVLEAYPPNSNSTQHVDYSAYGF